MIKKVDILGIQLDNYTVREAIMCVERYLSNNVLNTIESISLQMLIDSETNPVLKEVMSSLDLAIIGEKEIIQAISPAKDVDGFHPQSVGALSTGEPGFVSCTPAGIIQLLKRSGISIDGKDCVVVGRSNIVGKPMSMLLLRENGTVTICHSHTKNLKEVCQRADILVAAIGKPKFFDDSYVKDGAVVIDVGIHRNEENKLCGDVDYAAVEPIVDAITPVPGGVGSVTTSVLVGHVVEAAMRKAQ